jgi:hypothetical protein
LLLSLEATPRRATPDSMCRSPCWPYSMATTICKRPCWLRCAAATTPIAPWPPRAR